MVHTLAFTVEHVFKPVMFYKAAGVIPESGFVNEDRLM